MSFHKSRIDTIRALIAGSKSISVHSTFASVNREWDEVKDLTSVGVLRRRHLLAVLHSTRALDGALKVVVSHYNLSQSPSKSLGASLKHIENAPAGTFTSAFTMRARFQSTIVQERNRYMHEAGAYPANDGEIRSLLSEMEHCVTVILSLE